MYDDNQLNISLRAGLDFPSYDNQTSFIDYKSNLNLGASADFYFNNWIGLGLDFDYLKNNPKSSYPESNLYAKTAKLSDFSKTENKITRYFFGLGPDFRWVINDNLGFSFKLKGGISNIKGGETSLTANDGITNYLLNFHNGYNVKNVFTGKAQLEMNWFFSEYIGVNLGVYYIKHFKNNEIVDSGAAAGYIPFSENDNQYILNDTPEIRTTSNEHEIHSLGFFGGLIFRFPSKSSSSPNYTLTVTSRDKVTGTILPDTSVGLYKNEKRYYTAKTNSQGVAFFKHIQPDNYEIRGNYCNIDLEKSNINKSEFVKNSTVKKEIAINKEYFIVKGQVNICNSKNPLSGVTVTLKNIDTDVSKEFTTNSLGKFYFLIEKNSIYSIHGKKGNYFSRIETVTSKNVDRNNVLFINLEVCMEETVCGKSINLKNIHYDLDKYFIREDAKPELNNLAQFMKDNPEITVELSSHTDSRASDEYNKTLSQNRADAAVDYLVQQGIDKSRLKAFGYGESRLLNKCSDGVDCTEEEHQVNRRTEMKVICPK